MSLLVLPSFAPGAATAAVGGAATPLKRKVEAVGRAFQATKHAAPKPSAAPLASGPLSPVGQGASLRDAKYDHYKKYDIPLDDYYTLLGLQDKMFDATKEEITEQYRLICKVIHPDKALPEDRVKAEERYKALQVGWETLTDAARRRGYDSSLDFDDKLPKESAGSTEKTFFSVYGPVFESNARFSTIRPVPRLGDMSTPDDEVVAFYDFWNAFSSWREFPELNENSLESASCRQQKREYERENQKAQAAKKKEELARVRKLTEQAQKKDPRMVRMREAANRSKNEKAAARAAEAAQKEADAKQKLIDDAARAKAEAEAKVKEAENKKNFKEVQKKTRQAFGKSCKAAGLDDAKTDALRAKLEVPQMQAIVDLFAKDPKSQAAIDLFNSHQV